MKEQLISFETAKLAKEKGFDVKTIIYYRVSGSGPFDNSGRAYNWNDDEKMETVGGCTYSSAPTQSLLQKWLREKHNIHLEICWWKSNTWSAQLVVMDNKIDEYTSYDAKDCKTYEEALEIGLQKALKIIKINK